MGPSWPLRPPPHTLTFTRSISSGMFTMAWVSQLSRLLAKFRIAWVKAPGGGRRAGGDSGGGGAQGAGAGRGRRRALTGDGPQHVRDEDLHQALVQHVVTVLGPLQHRLELGEEHQAGLGQPLLSLIMPVGTHPARGVMRLFHSPAPRVRRAQHPHPTLGSGRYPLPPGDPQGQADTGLTAPASETDLNILHVGTQAPSHCREGMARWGPPSHTRSIRLVPRHTLEAGSEGHRGPTNCGGQRGTPAPAWSSHPSLEGRLARCPTSSLPPPGALTQPAAVPRWAGSGCTSRRFSRAFPPV